MLHIDVDISEADHVFARFEHADEEALLGLEVALATSFARTQEAVHVITGSLKNSGDVDSRTAGHTWIGSITYGGPSPGFPHDPVRYAAIERGRGGGHDFMRPARRLGHRVRQAVLDSIRGRA